MQWIVNNPNIFVDYATKQTRSFTKEELLAMLYGKARLATLQTNESLALNLSGGNGMVQNNLIANFDTRDVKDIQAKIQHIQDIERDTSFKGEFTRQMVIGMARLEGIPDEIIATMYWKLSIDEILIPKIQKILKTRNIGLIDCSLNDVTLSEQDRNLLIYTKLFLHEKDVDEKEDRITDQSMKSEYYTVDKEGKLKINKYGIKSYELAINCAYQLYQKDFHNIKPENSKTRHIRLTYQEDIEALYTNEWLVLSDGSVIDAWVKSHILSLTRAIMHIQSHKKLDYTGTKHDPAWFQTYEPWGNALAIFEKAFNDQRRLEARIIRDKEISQRWIKDSEGEEIKREPTNYDGENYSWSLKNLTFGWVNGIDFSGRMKSFPGSVWKLIHTPKYKHGKYITDNGAVTFHTKSNGDSCKVFTQMINNIDDRDLSRVRLDIKWDESRRVFLENIENIEKDWNKYSFNFKKESIESLWLVNDKLEHLYKNNDFAKAIYESQDSSEARKPSNTKTWAWYEEFKMILPSWTEVQIRTKEQLNDGKLAPIAHNELGKKWHWIYDGHKWINTLLRLYNELIPLDDTAANVIDNAINNAMEQEELYLWWKFTLEEHDMTDFNPWYAIYQQLIDKDWSNKESQYDYFNEDESQNRKLQCKQIMYKNILGKYVIIHHDWLKYLVPIESEKRYDNWFIEIYEEYLKRKKEKRK